MIDGMPDIPNFKGLETSGLDALIGFGGAFAINMIFGNVWGVFSQYGIPILLADTVYSVKYSNTSTVSSAPVERGSFTDYNKVQDPYKASVTLIKGGGSTTMRGLFLAQIDALSRTTILYHIVTPEYVHMNAAIVGYDYAREPQNGARMIAATLHLQEVRETEVEYETEETEEPEDMPEEDMGEVQPEEAEESLLSRASDALDGAIESVKDLIDRARESAKGIFDADSAPVAGP